jgi:hypothetical protein
MLLKLKWNSHTGTLGKHTIYTAFELLGFIYSVTGLLPW